MNKLCSILIRGVLSALVLMLILNLTACNNSGSTTTSPVQQWTWVGGSQESNTFGVYGILDVANATNMPGARAYAVSWTDKDGGLWLFSGEGLAESTDGNLNDLWHYSITNNQWIWKSGSKTTNQYGTYGVLGTSNTTNMPGARNVATAWTDKDGNLWLFGGEGFAESTVGDLNDLWRYSVANNQWTWISGSVVVNQYGVYGTQGVSNALNMPGARNDAMSWTDKDGNLWLFGGIGLAEAGTEGALNDLWRYSVADNQWTWIGGSKMTNQYGVYGVLNQASANNMPGTRSGAVTWTDKDGSLWLFGGYGFAATGASNYLNDVWRYSVADNQWTWIGGSDTIDQAGVYGTLGVESITNIPGARFLPASWADKEGNLWLFGGNGFAESTVGDLNDLWHYSIADNQWTWIGGSVVSNQYGVYGTQGVSNALNTPGARDGAVSWFDNSGNLWLMGGPGFTENTFGTLNDLWRYTLAH